jgi:predicted dehydrogenase
MQPLRLAFIGSPRNASPCLLHALNRIGALEALCVEDAEREAPKYHARWAYSDLASLLKEARPDGAIIQLPPEERGSVIRQCLAGGIGVLMTGTPGGMAACRRLDTLAKLAGRFVLAASPLRFSPAMLLARRLLESGKFGTQVSMSIRSIRRGQLQTSVDHPSPIAEDQLFELVDVVHSLVGPITRVFAVPHSEGCLAATLVADSGTLVSALLHAHGSADAVGLLFEIRASDGNSLTMDQDCRLSCGNGTRADALHGPSLAIADPTLELGYEGLLAEFRASMEVRGSSRSGCAGPWRDVLGVCEAVVASAAKGKSFTVKK